jgi:hypothetical protein
MEELLECETRGPEKRNVQDQNNNVLREIDKHVVAEKFANQIFKEDPSEKNVEPSSPVIQNGYNHQQSEG